MADIRMPNGDLVTFPDAMPREKIAELIETKFPGSRREAAHRSGADPYDSDIVTAGKALAGAPGNIAIGVSGVKQMLTEGEAGAPAEVLNVLGPDFTPSMLPKGGTDSMNFGSWAATQIPGFEGGVPANKREEFKAALETFGRQPGVAEKYAGYLRGVGTEAQGDIPYIGSAPSRISEANAAGLAERAAIAPLIPELDAQPGSVGELVGNVASSIAQMAPGYLLSAATRNPLPTVVLAQTLTTGQSYSDARAAGLSPTKAAQYAVSSGFAEAVGEALPLGMILKEGGGKLLPRLFKAGVSEAIQEGVTQFIQSMLASGSIDTDMTWDDVKGQVLTAMVTGGVAGATLTTAVEAFDRVGRSRPDATPTPVVELQREDKPDEEPAPELLALPAPGRILALPAPEAEVTIQRRHPQVSPIEETSALQVRDQEAEREVQARLALKRSQQTETAELLALARETITPIGTFSPQELEASYGQNGRLHPARQNADGTISSEGVERDRRAQSTLQQVNAWRGRTGRSIDAPITVSDLVGAKVPQAQIDALLAIKRPRTSSELLSPSSVRAAAANQNLLLDSNFAELSLRTTGSSNLDRMTQTQLHTLVSTIESMPKQPTPTSVPIATMPGFTEAQYDAAVTKTRADGRYSFESVKDAAGTKNTKIAAEIRDAMVRRGQLVHRGGTSYKLYDTVGAEKQAVPDDLPKGAFSEYTVKQMPVRQVRVKHGGKSIGTFESASEARAAVKNIRDKEREAGTKPSQIQMSHDVGADAFAVMENRYDESGVLLGSVAVNTSRSRADADRIANEMTSPTTPLPTEATTPVTTKLGYRSSTVREGLQAQEAASVAATTEAAATPQAKKRQPAPAGLAGREQEIIAKVKAHVVSRALPLLGVKTRLVSTIRTPTGGFADGRFFQKIISLATTHLDPSMSVEQIAEKLAGVIDHELIHALRQADVLSAKDKAWSTLTKYVTKAKRPADSEFGAGQTFIDFAQEHYGPLGLSPEAIVEEAIAEAFRAWAANKRNVVGTPATAFRQLVQWFKELVSAVPKDIFEAIDSGTMVREALTPPGSAQPRAVAVRNMKNAAKEVNKWGKVSAEQEAAAKAAGQPSPEVTAKLAEADKNIKVNTRKFIRARQQARDDRPGRSGPKTVIGTDASKSFNAGALGARKTVADIVARYHAKSGRVTQRLSTYLGEPMDFLRRVADAQDKLSHAPLKADVSKSYSALNAETHAMYNALTAVGGLQVTSWEGDGQPYATHAEMIEDVAKGRLRMKLSNDMFGPGADTQNHPMNKASGLTTTTGTPLTNNDIFRIVHDVYGRGQSGFRGTAQDDYNAYHEHARLVSAESLPALATETLAQSAWHHYGPHLRRLDGTIPREGDLDYLPSDQKEFSEQKAGLLADAMLREDPGFAAAKQADGAEPMYMVAWHGTPHTVDKFSTTKIGTGEGAQAFGWGLYFASKRAVAEGYRDVLSRRKGAVMSYLGQDVALDLTETTPELQAAHRLWVGIQPDSSYARAVNTGNVDYADHFLKQARAGAKADIAHYIEGFQDILADARLSKRNAFYKEAEKLLPVYEAALELVDTIDAAALTAPTPPGKLYKVEVPEDSELPNWDARLSKQPSGVKDKIVAVVNDVRGSVITRAINELRGRASTDEMVEDGYWDKVTFETFYRDLKFVMFGAPTTKKAVKVERERAVSELLARHGIPGHRYLDGGSRAAGDGSYNYVIYDDKHVEISDVDPVYSITPRKADALIAEVALPAAFELTQNTRFTTGRNLKLALQKRVRSLTKAAINTDTPRNVEYLTRSGIVDAEYAMLSNANAVGWYGRTVSKALSVLGTIHPEINTDPHAKFAFIHALAVTSNGMEVDKNFEMAEQAYAKFKKTGRMEQKIGAGKTAKAMNYGMAVFDTLVDAMGPEGAVEFMLSKRTVSQLTKMGFKVNGENAGTVVRGAAILGPKVGNGFFSNLYGHFDQLTIDRWLMRTWGRWSGTLVVPRPDMVALKSADLEQAVAAMRENPAELAEFEAALGTKLRGKMIPLAQAIVKASSKTKPRAVFQSTVNGEKLRLLGNSLAGWVDGQKEKPSNGTERELMRKVLGGVLKHMQANGSPDLTMSDLQALLWYPEKRLYDAAKSKEEANEEGYDDDAAPDYANAAIALAQRKGVNPAAIQTALKDWEKNYDDTNGRPAGMGRDASGAAEDTAPRYSIGGARSDDMGSSQDNGGVDGLRPRGVRQGLPDGSTKWSYPDGRDVTETPDRASFLEKLRAAKASHGAIGAQVAEEPGSRMFVFDDGQSGFSLDGDNIVAVFSTAAGPSGVATRVMDLAIQEGGRRLDGFQTFLPSLYAKNGFRAVAKMPFSREQAPEGWDYVAMDRYNKGEPPVVFMAYDPMNARADTDVWVGGYDAGEAAQRRALQPGDLQANPVGPGSPLFGEPRSPGGALVSPSEPAAPFTATRDGNQWFAGPSVAAQLRQAREGIDGAVLTYMSTDEYLDLTTGTDPQQKVYTAAAAEGLRFSHLPSVVVEGYAGNVRVVDHDGRYAAQALAGKVEKIPVVIYPKNKQELGNVTALDPIKENRNGQTDDAAGRGSRGSDRPTPVGGALRPLERLSGLPGRSPGPNPRVIAAANKYLSDRGMPHRRQAEHVFVDPTRAARIADAYTTMPHDPTSPRVREAYQAMIDEVKGQYQAAIDNGLQVEIIRGDDPYPQGPKQVLDDLMANNHLWVYPTDSGFGTINDITDNPLLEPTDFFVGEHRMLANDLFRVVHDYFGHGLEGAGFGPSGEENAWQAHMRMFTPTAALAMTSETRGQNSWVNYGPYGEQNRANQRDTVYADQKVGVMPDWVLTEGVVDDQPDPGLKLSTARRSVPMKPRAENYPADRQQGGPKYSVNAALGQRTARSVPTSTRNIVFQHTDNVISRFLNSVGRSKRNLPGLGASVFDARVMLQDSQLAVKEMLENVMESGGKVVDATNTYMQGRLYHGKVQAQLAKREKLVYQPLFDAIREAAATSNITVAEFEDYLYAKHAPERNAHLRARGATMDNPSGLSDEAALEIIDKAATSGKRAKLEELAKLAYAITADTTRTRNEAGLISDEAAAGSPYRFYVPLRGFADEDLDPGLITGEDGGMRAKTGQGFNIGGREDKRVTGRDQKAGSIIGHLLLQNTESVIRAEKNAVAASFFRLIKDNPNSGYGTVLESKPTRRVVGANGMIQEAGDPNYRQDPTIVTVKYKGGEIAIKTEARVARALRGDGVGANSGFVQFLGRMNRYLASINTARNPEFLISNLLRDVVHSGILAQQYNIDHMAWEITKNTPAAMKGIWSVLRKGDAATGKWADAFRELQAAGGTIEFMGIHNIDTMVNKFQRSVATIGNKPSPRQIMNQIRTGIALMDNANSAVENALRLGAFVAARNAGVSLDQAAFLARNLTVDFNVGGEKKTLANALYLFYNAGVQGGIGIAKGLKNKRVQKVVAGVIAAGVIMDFVNRLGSDDDDDNGIKDYDEIPEHILERNLIIMLPGSRNYVAWPMPYGFNGFYNIGRNLSNVFSGSPVHNPGKSLISAGMGLIDGLNPLGSLGDIMNMVLPTFLDPLWDLATNKDFTGRDIVPERMPAGGVPVPNSQLAWASTNPAYKWVAEQMNSLTGGDVVAGGAVDISPEALEYVWDYATGGAGKFLMRGTTAAANVVSGNWQDVEMDDVVFMRKMVGSVNNRGNTEAFYTNALEILTLKQRIDVYSEDGDMERVQQLVLGNRSRVPLIGLVDQANKDLSDLRKTIREVRAAPIPEEKRRVIIEQAQARMDFIMARVNKAYYRAVGPKP